MIFNQTWWKIFTWVAITICSGSFRYTGCSLSRRFFTFSLTMGFLSSIQSQQLRVWKSMTILYGTSVKRWWGRETLRILMKCRVALSYDMQIWTFNSPSNLPQWIWWKLSPWLVWLLTHKHDEEDQVMSLHYLHTWLNLESKLSLRVKMTRAMSWLTCINSLIPSIMFEHLTAFQGQIETH